MSNVRVVESTVLNVKSNLINLLLVSKFKNGVNLQINKKIMNSGFKNTQENVPHANNLFKNTSVVIM